MRNHNSEEKSEFRKKKKSQNLEIFIQISLNNLVSKLMKDLVNKRGQSESVEVLLALWESVKEEKEEKGVS